MKAFHLFMGLLICSALFVSNPVASAQGTGSSEGSDPSLSEHTVGRNAPDALRILETLQEQQRQMANELRSVKREIAALKAAVSEPDFKDILGGIGYILGIFGIASYLHARRREKRPAFRPE